MQRWRYLLVIVPVLAACAAGCDNQVSPQAQQMFNTGRDAYLAGDDAKAVQNLDLFLVGNDRTKLADEAFYYRGLARYRQKDVLAARMDFNQVINRTGKSDLKAQAMKALGDLAYDGNDMGTAESMYTQALTLLDQTKAPVDEIRYRLGQTLQRQARWSDADLQFNRLIYVFPTSEFARRAARLVNCNTWTIQVGAFENKASADAMIGQLKAKGLPASARMVQGDRAPLFAVQAGRYASYDDARAALPGVKGYDALVTPTR